MCDDYSIPGNYETEARVLLDAAKKLIRAVRYRDECENGLNYLDMECDNLDETLVNLFGNEHRGPIMKPVFVQSRRTPPAHSRRFGNRVRRVVAIAM
jgi:hypothetical protein